MKLSKKNGNHVSSYVGSLWKIAEYLKSIYEGFKYHNELVHAFFFFGISEVHFKHLVLVWEECCAGLPSFSWKKNTVSLDVWILILDKQANVNFWLPTPLFYADHKFHWKWIILGKVRCFFHQYTKYQISQIFFIRSQNTSCLICKWSHMSKIHLCILVMWDKRLLFVELGGYHQMGKSCHGIYFHAST